MARILVADDDAFILQFIDKVLRSQDHETILTSNGEQALDMFQQNTPDLVLLDVIMPKLDGFQVCQQIRSRDPLVPILMLTARMQVENKVKGLDSGADDYITKPFDRFELIARIQSALRRQEALQGKNTAPLADGISVSDLSLHFKSWQADFRKTPLKLSRTEFKLLRIFCEYSDQVLDRDFLLSTVWNYKNTGATRTVDNFIMRLRKKLQTVVEEHGETAPFLETLYGVGYRLNCSDAPPIHTFKNN
jgi:DNA-binding response OmpR family regulator